MHTKCVRKSFDYVKSHLVLKVVNPLKVGLPTLFFITVPVFTGRALVSPLKHPREVAGAVKTTSYGDFRDALAGLGEQKGSFRQTVADQILHGRDPQCPAEAP